MITDWLHHLIYRDNTNFIKRLNYKISDIL